MKDFCESCEEYEGEDMHRCPYKQANFVDSEGADEECNCCDACYAKCKERS